MSWLDSYARRGIFEVDSSWHRHDHRFSVSCLALAGVHIILEYYTTFSMLAFVIRVFQLVILSRAEEYIQSKIQGENDLNATAATRAVVGYFWSIAGLFNLVVYLIQLYPSDPSPLVLVFVGKARAGPWWEVLYGDLVIALLFHLAKREFGEAPSSERLQEDFGLSLDDFV